MVHLGGAEGLILDYPRPSSPAASKIMRANKRSDSKPEIALRSALHAAGARFRKDFPVRTALRRPVRVDVAFTAVRVAVLVHGCFWHRCPTHGSSPRANSEYWTPKLARNVQRDAEVEQALVGAGWISVIVWEHDPSAGAAERVLSVVASRRPGMLVPSD